MARLAIAAALLMLLLITAQASTYRAIITTEIYEPNPSETQRCRHQLHDMSMDSCRRYLQPYMLFTRTEARAQKCCDELQNVNHNCRCEALQQTTETVRSYQGQGGQQQQKQQMREVMQKAQQLPQICGFQQQCNMRQDEH